MSEVADRAAAASLKSIFGIRMKLAGRSTVSVVRPGHKFPIPMADEPPEHRILALPPRRKRLKR